MAEWFRMIGVGLFVTCTALLSTRLKDKSSPDGLACRDAVKLLRLSESQAAVYNVINNTTSEISIVGLQVSCICIRPVGLPLRIAPRHEAELVIRYEEPCAAGSQRKRFDFLPMVIGLSSKPPHLHLDVECDVVPPTQDSELRPTPDEMFAP